jgi:acyl-CoA reductase-like NAD-dependent aldehyde dehydrogenase
LVDCVVQTAKQSLRTSGWADVRPRERVVALQRWTDLIQKEALTLGRLEAVSTARPIAQLVGADVKVIAEQMPIARPTAWPYTRDISGAVRIAKALQAGTDGVNRYGRTRHHILPTSGYKHPAQGSRAGSVPRQS